MPENLTFDSLRATMALMPKYRTPCGATAIPEYCARLRKELNCVDLLTPFGTISLYEKPGQITPIWVFHDLVVMRKYLNGELTELDLIPL